MTKSSFIGGERPTYGTDYTDLFKLGWFNNPRVAKAFGVNHDQDKASRTFAIKAAIYEATGVDSLAKLPPADFVRLIASKGLVFTLPSSLKAAAGI